MLVLKLSTLTFIDFDLIGRWISKPLKKLNRETGQGTVCELNLA